MGSYGLLLFISLSLVMAPVSRAEDIQGDAAFGLSHEVQFRSGGAFLVNSVGFQVDVSYLNREMSQSILPFLANERIGFGVQYLRIKSSNSVAQAESFFFMAEVDNMLRRMFGTLPIFATIGVGLSQVSIQKEVVSSGFGFMVTPKVHYRFPEYFDGISSEVFVGYSAIVGGQSLFSTSVGLGMGYQF